MLEHIPHGIGEALGGVRAGMAKTVIHQAGLADLPSVIGVSSPTFGEGGSLDRRFTADGEGVSPALHWRGAPASSRGTVVVVEDADSPTASPLLHLTAWLEGGDGAVPEGAWGPGSGDDRTGLNGFHARGWLAPDPPPGHGPHRYLFQVFAVDRPAYFEGAPHKDDVLRFLQEHAVAMGSVVGVYARP